jgi:hypothetical protein
MTKTRRGRIHGQGSDPQANGLTATPEVVAAVIACVLLKTWKPDEKKRDELVALLSPLVEREMGRTKI